MKEQWWICSGGFLDQGGRKKLGPFASEALAKEVRRYVERVERTASYWVSSEKVAS